MLSLSSYKRVELKISFSRWFLIQYLLHEKDEDLPEHLDKVNEEVQRMGNEVLVSISGLPDYKLGVEHDEPTEDSQANPDMCLDRVRV